MSRVPRDQEITRALERVGVLTSKQVQTLGFSLDNDTSCTRRLGKLVAARMLERLPRPSASYPFIYHLPGSKAPHSLLLEHQLGIAEIYVRVARACQELGFTLERWLGPSTLQPLISFAPDAFFHIKRIVDGVEKNAGFFLEYEHTPRHRNVLIGKLRAYSKLYYSGAYRMHLDIRGNRVLVVYADPQRVSTSRGTARNVGFNLARLTSLEALTSCHPIEFLTGPIWYNTTQDEPTSLYQLQEQQ